MTADKTFPVTVGTVVTLSCKAGFKLKGDNTVTCTKDTEFKFSTEPQCGEYCEVTSVPAYSVLPFCFH